MQEKIKHFIEEVDAFHVETKEQLENFRIKFLSKKGILAELFSEMKSIDPGLRKEVGKWVNDLKNKAEEKLKSGTDALEYSGDSGQEEIDLTLPGEPIELGARHPLSIVRRDIIEIFGRIGYTVAYGPEIEDDWHNFSALNFPENHPARDMQDTFFISPPAPQRGEHSDNKAVFIPPLGGGGAFALRTHTSSVQVRVMETTKPPIRVLAPGRVYRNEAISARAHCFFHQVEGLYVDEGVSFADLKQTLYYFAQQMFSPPPPQREDRPMPKSFGSADDQFPPLGGGGATQVRFRPSYFPFTEPSAEMDISCNICGGKGCNVCKYSGWVEILGCGMVHPNVLENCKIDAKKYSGFAFGLGIERIAMLRYQINDLRIFSENDVRFLKQFSSAL